MELSIAGKPGTDFDIEANFKSYVIEPLRWKHNGRPSISQVYPEKKLMAAVLAQAIKDMLNNRVSEMGGRYPTRQDLEEARHWFNSHSQELYSFEWICNELRINPQLLRTWISDIYPTLTGSQRNEISRQLALITVN